VGPPPPAADDDPGRGAGVGGGPLIRLLLDSNLSHKLAPRLADVYPGIAHVRSLGFARSPDSGVWRLAVREGFTAVVTCDQTFDADAATSRGPAPRVIELWSGNKPSVVEDVLRRHRELIVAFHADPGVAKLVLPPVPPRLPAA